jgi:hypothetical protein
MKTTQKTNGYTEKLITLLAKNTGIDISKFDINELVKGMLVELEHGTQNAKTNITNDDAIQTFKIVMAHMEEISDYYTRLEKMEDEAKSVKTNNDENKDSKLTSECISKRFKELCGLIENENKKQLKNMKFSEKAKVNLLKEEIDVNKFKILKFNNDGLGKKETEEDENLYSMEKKKED